MRVMFVDDEARVLEGIERALFVRARDWDVRFARSGPEALAALEREDVDVLVSDMRMPGMDGAELLLEVQRRWPETLRMVLSGHADQQPALRAMAVAHQYLCKPCDAAALVSSIEQLYDARKLVPSIELRSTLGQIGDLPAAPATYLALADALGDARSEAADISHIIDRDPSVSAKVLKLANSAFFRRSHPVASIKAAVTRLGMATLRTLVLAAEMFPVGTADPHVEALRSRAILASLLGARLATSDADRETCATAALLADIGLLVPGLAHVASATELAANASCHAQIGAYLLGTWGLPAPIVVAVACHHDPGRIEKERFGPIGTVHAAVALAADEEPDLPYLQRTGVAARWPEWKKIKEALKDDELC